MWKCYLEPQLIRHHVDSELTDKIRQSVNKRLVLGNDRFKDEVEQLTGQRTRPAKQERPAIES
ncbi:hypothetical protein KO507_06795 [Gilvimarinus agarilyticus]|uniref:hypothetical protein n=1 Tax=Gilvimarinus sp. 2_MG-2023 TaxID=3062666 RepID=UPI001C0A3157|nr:hypothetical protein [Gilvimarinus sp. 2_MG-2023]MBU2885464.1 hypothetical protein [Gilvimarinus agarilyticus]MDO6570364.1 hypothetical protein [Gilvimarinus sp. 2_MG-2023]